MKGLIMNNSGIESLKNLIEKANLRKAPHLRLSLSDSTLIVEGYEDLYNKYYSLIKENKDGKDMNNVNTLDGGLF